MWARPLQITLQIAPQHGGDTALWGRYHAREMEATTGFEPVNSGFADRRLRPLGYVAQVFAGRPRIDVAAPRGFEPRLTDPKSAVLPLDEGAIERPGLVYEVRREGVERKTGLEPATLTLAR